MNVLWWNAHPETVSHPGMWDDTLLRELLDGDLGPVPEDGNVLVIPGRYHVDDIDAIQAAIDDMPHVLVIVTADEANEFPVDQLHHERMQVWCQTMRPGRFEQGFIPFPLGYPPDTLRMIQDQGFPQPSPDLWWWFSGQVTHQRRQDAATALQSTPKGQFHSTEGFTQGLPRRTYLEALSRCMVAPCPSGPETQDTFRMWEALAAGVIPLVDGQSLKHGDDGFWTHLLGDHPLPVIQDWAAAPAMIEELVTGWPHTSNRVEAWWTRYRRSLARQLTDAMGSLDVPAVDDPQALVTVLIPTSPVASHPDTAFIEQTYDSVRERWPRSDIRIMVDGVRPEQWTYTRNYQEYTRRLLWLSQHRWWNVTVRVHDAHMHQAAMAAVELETVNTPLVLYVEHDAPLMNDWPVDDLVAAALDPQVDLLRLNHEHEIHPDHRHLLVGDPTVIRGIPLQATRQWSQRPHLAKTSLYKKWLTEWFKPTERSMIEDRMHSVVQRFPWRNHKIWLYVPEGNQQRSWHSDARGDDIKWPNN